MRLKLELFLSPRPKRHKLIGRPLLICFIILVGFGQKVATSSNQTVSPSRHISSSTTTYTSALSSSLVPTPSPLPPNICWSGPDTEEFRNVIIGTSKIYLDLSKPINCSGAIISWQYCHYIIGFRNASSGLWPCVWRRSFNLSDSEAGYENVGCNRFIVVPGDGDDFRCRDFLPSNPADVIEVEEGDYIGFYVPDSGLLPALSIVNESTGLDKLLRVRNVTGFTSYLKDSELRIVTPQSGSALLRAEIGTLILDTSTIILSTQYITRPQVWRTMIILQQILLADCILFLQTQTGFILQ